MKTNAPMNFRAKALVPSLLALAASSAFQDAAGQITPGAVPGTSRETTVFDAEGSPFVGASGMPSYLRRLNAAVADIRMTADAEQPSADGVSATKVSIELTGRDGVRLKQDQEVTIEVSGGARVLLAGRRTNEAGADAGDADKVAPAIQLKVLAGQAYFSVLAPSVARDVVVRVSADGRINEITLRYQPDLRQMVVVGLLEGRLRQDQFDPSQIVPVRENDGFEEELRGFSKEFAGGRGSASGRAALYLKGKIRGDYLLTVNYDSDKITRQRLFDEVDPNAFYPVYGDSSLRGNDAQSATKLYVRLDRNRNFLLIGDLTTNDSNVARNLSQYNRAMPGVQARFEEGNVRATAFLARESLRQVVDEFPARGVSGPYSVSNPNGVVGSERVELVVRSRFQAGVILKATPLSRSVDYEFEAFSGRILFRNAVPSFDDQLNPISIRVTYEVDQGGERYTVAGGDVRLQLTTRIAIGAAVASDKNPLAPYQIVGVNAHMKLTPATELIAEHARSQATGSASLAGGSTGLPPTLADRQGEFSGGATRIEVRHAGEGLNARAAVSRADSDFYNPSSGTVGGRRDASVNIGWKATDALSVSAELQNTKDSAGGIDSQSAAVGLELKLTDQLRVGGGVRRVAQNAASLAQSSLIACSNSAVAGTYSGVVAGYNTGFGISPSGNQAIDPTTGRPILCAAAVAEAAADIEDVERTQAYAKIGWKATPNVDLESELSRTTGTDPSSAARFGARWKVTDRLGLHGDIQKSFSGSDATLARVGADWQVWDKTRLFARLERSQQYSGKYDLGTGPIETGFSVGIDTEYMRDGSVFSEYRLRDAASGRDVQRAIGLRNAWTLAEGLRLTTNVERLAATTGDTTALGAGVEYTASKLWKSSGRIEWREDDSNRNWLVSGGVALKLNRDWSLLSQYYLNLVKPEGAAVAPAPGTTPASGLGLATSRQSQLRTGFAYRPVDYNNIDVLALYENRDEDTPAAGIDRSADIVSLRVNYHPSRPWWITGRYAMKRVDELLEGTVRDRYTAQLFGGRVMYDITNRWSLGANFTMLQGSNSSRQYAYGLEVGYVVMDNLWVTLGYNWRGFSDRDLSASEYTNRGWVLGVRYKFDEDLFKKDDAAVNKTLTSSPEKAKP